MFEIQIQFSYKKEKKIQFLIAKILFLILDTFFSNIFYIIYFVYFFLVKWIYHKFNYSAFLIQMFSIHYINTRNVNWSFLAIKHTFVYSSVWLNTWHKKEKQFPLDTVSHDAKEQKILLCSNYTLVVILFSL